MLYVHPVSFQNVTQVVRRAQVVLPLSVLPVLMVTMTTQEHVQVSEYLTSLILGHSMFCLKIREMDSSHEAFMIEIIRCLEATFSCKSYDLSDWYQSYISCKKPG